MASTLKVNDTLNWVAPFIKYSPLSVGTNSEPAVSNANLILQTFVSPPFVWRWNRKTVSFTTTANVQDVTQAIADFGFLEKATITDANGNVVELKQQDLISEVSTAAEASRPTYISTQSDDNAGNITFRFSPVPDATYTVKLTYQKKPTLVTAAGLAAATWSPIPDEYAFVYQNGMLALGFAAVNDARFQVFWTRFLAALVGVSEGLSEMDKVLFISNMLDFASQVQAAQIAVNQGKQGRVTG